MRQQQKIGTFTTFSMMVASVIGIGIFLKNKSVFTATGNNPTGTMVAWGIAALTSFLLAIAYADISTTAQSREGLSKWAEKVGGAKIAYFIKSNYTFLYYGVYGPVLSYFVAEILLFNLSEIKINNLSITKDALGERSSILLTLGFGTGLYIFFLSLNYYSIKFAGYFQNAALICTFIPLFAVSVFGIVFGCLYSEKSLWSSSSTATKIEEAVKSIEEASKNGGDFSKLKIYHFNLLQVVAALPAILFAFDNFVGFGALAPNVKRAEKTVPFVFIFGILTISAIYLSVTVAQTFTGLGISWEIFRTEIGKKFLSEERAKIFAIVMKQVVYFFIIFSIGSTLNSFCASGINLFTEQTVLCSLIGSKLCLKLAKKDHRLAGYFLFLLTSFFWSAIIIPISIIENTDFWIDGISNLPSFFFFLVYGVVAILATIDKIKRKVKFTFKNCLCAIAAFFGFLLTTTIVLYQLGYVIFYQQFYDKFSKTNDMPWGSFIGNPSQAKGWLVGTVFFSFSFLFAFFPLINKSLISFFTYLTKKPTYSDPNHDPWLAKVVSNNQLQRQRRVKYLLQPFTPKIVKSPAKKSSQPVTE